MAARQGVVAAMVLLAGVSVAGCKSSSSASAESDTNGAASVTAVQGKEGINRVALTADAAERIDLQTGTVRSRATAAKPAATAVAGTLTVPLDAVLYDKDGATWVYVGTGTLAFQRERITISGIDGDLAVLSAGPAVGTAVVTVGAAELLGAEDGVPGE